MVALTVVSVALEVFPELEGEQARQAIASAVESSLIKIAFLLRSLSGECYYEGSGAPRSRRKDAAGGFGGVGECGNRSYGTSCGSGAKLPGCD